jgi:predicted metal-dependent HD superfamily phosphohydrolase
LRLIVNSNARYQGIIILKTEQVFIIYIWTIMNTLVRRRAAMNMSAYLSLEDEFRNILKDYANQEQIGLLWAEISSAYQHPRRHYHSLDHLQYMYNELIEVQKEIKDWHTVMFALFYHDFKYNVLKSDNEEKSAIKAENVLFQFKVPAQIISKCKEFILSTKLHRHSNEPDCNFFTDADLSILGQPEDVYERYADQVRKEYSVFPDLVYNPGRRKVLKHFLAMEKIFKTKQFFSKYEDQARINLTIELNRL